MGYAVDEASAGSHGFAEDCITMVKASVNVTDPPKKPLIRSRALGGGFRTDRGAAGCLSKVGFARKWQKTVNPQGDSRMAQYLAI